MATWANEGEIEVISGAKRRQTAGEEKGTNSFGRLVESSDIFEDLSEEFLDDPEG